MKGYIAEIMLYAGDEQNGLALLEKIESPIRETARRAMDWSARAIGRYYDYQVLHPAPTAAMRITQTQVRLLEKNES